MTSPTRAAHAAHAAFGGCFALMLVGAQMAHSQTSVRFDHPAPGDCELLLVLAGVPAGSRVSADVEFTRYASVPVANNGAQVTVQLAEPLSAGYRLQAQLNGQSVPSSTTTVPDNHDRTARGTCAASGIRRVTAPAPLTAWIFYGVEVDNFTADSVDQYRNPGAATVRKTQQIVGVNFEYRAGRFVLAGESLHAVRTADINCNDEEAKNAKVCTDFSADPNNIQQRARYILENASSLEIALHPRYEIGTLGGESESPVALYGTGRIGFTSTSGVPYILKSYWAGGGLVAKDGPLSGSFLEIAGGKNHLFGSGTRLRGDALLSFRFAHVPFVEDKTRVFVEGLLDEGFAPFPTSYRTFFGLDLDVRALSR